MSTESKREHAYRLLRTVPPHRRKVLCQIARREGRWPHVDWDLAEKGGPVPPAEPLLCVRCGAEPVKIEGDVCGTCRQELEVARRERAERRAAVTRASRLAEPERLCPDCGSKRPKGHSRCAACATKAARKKARERKRRQRVKHREPVSRFC